MAGSFCLRLLILFGLKALEGAQGPKHEILGLLTFLISADKTRLHIISKSGKKCSPRWQTWVVCPFRNRANQIKSGNMSSSTLEMNWLRYVEETFCCTMARQPGRPEGCNAPSGPSRRQGNAGQENLLRCTLLTCGKCGYEWI